MEVSWVPALQKDTRTRNVYASTAIEGNPLTHRCSKTEIHPPRFVDKSTLDIRLNAGYNEAMKTAIPKPRRRRKVNLRSQMFTLSNAKRYLAAGG